MYAVATELPINSMKSDQKHRIMYVNMSTGTLHECCFFICLPQSTIAQVSRSKQSCGRLPSRSPMLQVQPIASHQRIPLTCRALFMRNAPPTQTLVLHLDSILHHTTSFAQRSLCFIQLPSFQMLTCNPPPGNFPAMMMILHAVKSLTWCAWTSDAAKLPSARRSAGHCSSIMDAVFILV